MEQLDLLRTRPVDGLDLLCIQIDGVWIGKLCLGLSVGIDSEGTKHALDFKQGCSESKAVVTALIERLRERGIEESDERRRLVNRDGSPAIESALRSYWPAVLQQECLIHQEGNVSDKLRKRDKAETMLHFKWLRDAPGKEAGKAAFADLLDFISERNAAANLAFKARKDSLLTVHRLQIPSTLNGTLTNTNIIHNTIRNWREANNDVKLWNEKETMIPR